MKIIKILLFVLAGICLLTTCSEDEELFNNDISSTENLKCTGHHNQHSGLNQDRYLFMRDVKLKVHYRVIGKGPVDMVFISGWTNPLTVYTKQFDYFRDKARCIYIDLPGHGLSDAPEDIEYTMGLMADAIYDVVKKEGLHRFIAVGFSWGHSPLTQFEIKHPGMIKQLILLDVGIIQWPPMNSATRDATCAFLLAMTPEVKLAQLNGLIPPATAPEDLIEFGTYFLDFPNWLLTNMYYYYLDEEACQPYAWTIPILGVFREMNSVKETRARLFFPNIDIQVIGGDQHVIQWAYDETVNELIEEFIIEKPGRRYGPRKGY